MGLGNDQAGGDALPVLATRCPVVQIPGRGERGLRIDVSAIRRAPQLGQSTGNLDTENGHQATDSFVDTQALHINVADRINNRIQMFTREGEFLRQVRVTNEGSDVVPVPAGFAFSPDREQQFLYVVDSGPMRVVIFDRKAMTQIGVVGMRGTNPGEFDIVHHMAVDSKGNLYTAEIVNNRRAQKFVLTGTQ